MANYDGNQDNKNQIYNQKALFAEDLINYILQKNSLPGLLLITERQEENCIRIFDNNVRIATEYSNNTVESYTEKLFNYITDYNLNSIPWFADYAYTAKGIFYRNASHPEGFLNYSVHLAQLAARLCMQGTYGAPSIVLRNIVEEMNFNLSAFGHHVRNMIARANAEPIRLSMDRIEQPAPYRTDESFVGAREVQMWKPHENLNQCEAKTDNFHLELLSKEKIDEYNAAISLSYQLKLEVEFDKMKEWLISQSKNMHNVSSSGFIPVPGAEPISSGAEPINVPDQEHHSSDSSEDITVV